ncbi:hypothetical protein ACIB24_12410 [Spongisporangium articulatum]|uniref:Lipase family protein n=1 Tax=Spongisporangium articulatum TaxID=3362603 RepID=A0ABW8AP28_9ACTN
MPDDDATVWELRVHGVSDTPPESVLRTRPPGVDHLQPAPDDPLPKLKRVAGDETVGFYQLEQRPTGADERFEVEAFSWGQLTSGRRITDGSTVRDLRRAAWSVLLPFALLNVAMWARPRVSATPGDEGGSFRLGFVVRLLALSLTGTIVLTAVGFGMDELAWQCRGGCGRNVYGLGFLQDVEGGRLAVVGSLLPLLALAFMVAVVWRTFRYEASVPAPGAGRVVSGQEPGELHPMEDENFWRGAALVRVLRWAHLAVALAAVAHALAATVWAYPSGVVDDAGPVGAAAAVSIGSGVVVALAAVAVLLMGLAGKSGRLTGSATWVGRVATTLAVVLVAVGEVVAWNGAGPAADWTASGSYATYQVRSLPGFEGTTRWLYVVQGALLIWCLLENGFEAHAAREALDPQLRDGPDRPAWRGLGTTLFAGGGWAIGLVFSAGVLLGGSWWLNTGDNKEDVKAGLVREAANHTARTSATMQWAAVGLVFGAVLAVAAVGIGLLHWWRLVVVERRRVVEAGGLSGEHARVAAAVAARWRGLHLFDGYRVFSYIGWLATGAALVMALGWGLGTAQAFNVQGTGTPSSCEVLDRGKGRAAELSWSVAAQNPHGPCPFLPRNPSNLPEHVVVVTGWLSDVGGFVAVGVLLAVVALLSGLFRKREVRRLFGIVWDVVTFWPRAAHPFGPPCYAEEAVPKLLTRVAGRPERPLVLAGHSQGGLLAVAAVLRTPDERRRTTFLLTYGTQITRFYGRAFPAFFGPAMRGRIEQRLTGGPDDESRPDVQARWRSLWRPTDPLGWPISATARLTRDDGEVDADNRIDRPVVDPAGYTPVPPGEVLDPPVRQHSDYPLSPEYLDERDAAAATLLRIVG